MTVRVNCIADYSLPRTRNVTVQLLTDSGILSSEIYGNIYVPYAIRLDNSPPFKSWLESIIEKSIKINAMNTISYQTHVNQKLLQVSIFNTFSSVDV